MSNKVNSTRLAVTARLVAAHVESNFVETDRLPDLIQSVYRSLALLGTPDIKTVEAAVPAVPIKRSVFPDFIVCLEDGRKLKLLKRHLRVHFKLSPNEYRAKWGLPFDYPMVAPNYANKRSGLAKSAGLGLKPSTIAEDVEVSEAEGSKVTVLPKRRARGSKG